MITRLIDSHIYLLMIFAGKTLRGLFEHERLKPAVIKTILGNASSLP